jgi:hypothetical protein
MTSSPSVTAPDPIEHTYENGSSGWWISGCIEEAQTRSLGPDPAQLRTSSDDRRCKTLAGLSLVRPAISPVDVNLVRPRVYGVQIPSAELARDRRITGFRGNAATIDHPSPWA